MLTDHIVLIEFSYFIKHRCWVCSYSVSELLSTELLHCIVCPVVAWYDFEINKENGMNVLGLVVYSIAMGIITAKLGKLGEPIYLLTLAIAEATMKLVTAVIWYVMSPTARYCYLMPYALA